MNSISVIRTAFQTRLNTISGLTAYDKVPGTINVPAAVVHRRSGPRQETEGGTAVAYTFVVTLFATLASDLAGQDALDALISPDGSSGSVVTVIDADPTLGGKVDFAQIADVEADQILAYGGIDYIGTNVVVEVGA